MSITGELEAIWSDYDLDELASDGAKFLSRGSSTDWGLPADIEPKVPPITLGGGIPDPDSLPRQQLLESMSRTINVPTDEPLRYGGGVGYEDLRHEMAKRFNKERGANVTAEHFLMTNGSAGAIDLVCSAYLSPGDTVITERPTFSGSVRTFRGHQANIVTIPIDDNGMCTDQLEDTIDKVTKDGSRVKIIYTIATFHNPAGISMSQDRREELLRIAAKHQILVVDDEAYAELYFPSTQLPTDLSTLSGCHGVISVGTFSKIIATGLRVGWIHGDPRVLDHVLRMRFDMGNSPLLHHMLTDFMSSGQLDEHIISMRSLYQEKCSALANGLRDYCEPYLTFKEPLGGFFMWINLQHGLDPKSVQAAAVEEGLIAPSGHAFFPHQEEMDSRSIRLAYSWAQKGDLEEAAKRLGRACERVAAGDISTAS
jgi:2-aminoadipate transaminase|tara:strand:- start:218 stop:1495 length:1278 start_codon:yes stop_codon:yes gene_type:complete